jgi:hypothetical protein
MNPRVKSVSPESGHRLRLTFTNGEVGIYDCSHLLDLGVFRELRDPEYFRQVGAADGTVVWPHEQDICPDTLHEDSYREEASPNKPVQRTASRRH